MEVIHFNKITSPIAKNGGLNTPMISHGKSNVKIGDMEARRHNRKTSMPTDFTNSNTKLPEIKKEILVAGPKTSSKLKRPT
jgi:hypothetical protein